MNFTDFVNVRMANIDKTTGAALSHSEVYRRGIEKLGGIDAIKPYIPFSLDKIEDAWNSGDIYLNTLGLKLWDEVTKPLAYDDPAPKHSIVPFLKSKSVNCSVAEIVCLLKEAAIMWVESETKKKRICFKMVEDGLMAKVIQVKLVEGELRAQIGDHWFWIGCQWKYEGRDPDTIPSGEKARRIFEVLEEFYSDGEQYQSEYLYYWYYLVDNI